MKKITTLLVLLFSLNSAMGQPPPPGINYYYVIDNDNDGFTTFDVNYYINSYMYNKALTMGFDLSGYQLSLFPSFTDYINNTNVIGISSYVNQVSSTQYCNLKLEYSGTGISYDQATLDNNFSNVILKTVNPDSDDDNDTILNNSEDLNNDKILNNEDTDSDGVFNFLDNDDDGDTILTINEDYNLNGSPIDDDTNTNGIPDYLDNGVVLTSDSFISEQEVRLFPNPVQNTLTVSAPNSNYQSIEILDLTGKVYSVTNENASQIDFSEYQPGIYFVKINRTNAALLFKIVKL